jgi:hypothetical protein
MRFFAALVLSAVLSGPASAEGIVSAGLEETLPGHADVTYLELLRQLAPDLALAADGTADGHLAKALRYASGGEPSAEAGEPVVIDRVTALPVRAEGKDRLLLMVDLGDGGDRAESFAMLALVDNGPSPKIADAADVSSDLFTSFFDPPLLALSPDDQAVLISNRHSNSNQSYDSTLMLFVRDGRITAIGDVFAFGDWWCGFRHLQTPSFEIVPEPGQPYASIRASVRDAGIFDGDACEGEERPEPFERTVSATWRWDAEEERFIADSDALEKLAEEDEDRF